MSESAKEKDIRIGLQTEHVCGNINFILKILFFQPVENTDKIIMGKKNGNQT